MRFGTFGIAHNFKVLEIQDRKKKLIQEVGV